jgi:hypothetical protein
MSKEMREQINKVMNFGQFLNENKNHSVTNLILNVRNKWIENYGSEEDAENEAMYASCDGFAYDVINLLNDNDIKFDLLNSITYTKRVGGISGNHVLLKKQYYENWYSKLPSELNNDKYFGNFEFPYHEWLYIDGKHYDFINFNGVDSVFDMKWMIDYFEYVKNKTN